MKILVTGIAGFIGHALAEKLLKCADEAISLDDISQETIENKTCTLRGMDKL